ncbi:hypothetical protein Taro_050184 [Colocasia esculenta]|uniref:1-deoxy-D-xylulose-5-phosphate synthase n=1 Tax=Colocasia esculenta TaxID=4460 RepID=A0A843XD25_COLES|nr:hypothetical protein [Colocasia esculenta]
MLGRRVTLVLSSRIDLQSPSRVLGGETLRRSCQSLAEQNDLVWGRIAYMRLWSELKQLSDELRSDVIFNVSKTGGHLGSRLGVVELTVALHYVFNTPHDKILWDVGHQSYPHKIHTGRRNKMPTMRHTNGLSGFTKRSESEHDCFGTGHNSTSISAAFGMAVGRDLKGRKNNVIAVIGDGAMTVGQAYEAMNNAGYLDSDRIAILNDNKQLTSKRVKLLDTYGSQVAIGIVMSIDPTKILMGRPIGQDLCEVAVLLENKPDSPLFIKDHNRKTMKDAIRSHILWFLEYVQLDCKSQVGDHD